jgi:hypothetical protein
VARDSQAGGRTGSGDFKFEISNGKSQLSATYPNFEQSFRSAGVPPAVFS